MGQTHIKDMVTPFSVATRSRMLYARPMAALSTSLQNQTLLVLGARQEVPQIHFKNWFGIKYARKVLF